MDLSDVIIDCFSYVAATVNVVPKMTPPENESRGVIVRPGDLPSTQVCLKGSCASQRGFFLHATRKPIAEACCQKNIYQFLFCFLVFLSFCWVLCSQIWISIKIAFPHYLHIVFVWIVKYTSFVCERCQDPTTIQLPHNVVA